MSIQVVWHLFIAFKAGDVQGWSVAVLFSPAHACGMFVQNSLLSLPRQDEDGTWCHGWCVPSFSDSIELASLPFHLLFSHCFFFPPTE